MNRFSTNQLEKTGQPRIGIFGVGYSKYWEQFPGLYEELMIKQETIKNKIPARDANVIDFGMVDTPSKAYDLVKELQAANLDLIFCNMLTYATSGTFGIIIKTLSIPIILVALQPRKALDYTKASTYMQLLNDDICSLPEFAGAAVRLGKPVPDMIIGTLHNDPEVEIHFAKYCKIAKVLHDLKNVQLAHIGHPINSMMDMQTDPTMLTSAFGCHIVECEANEIVTQFKAVKEDEIKRTEKLILDFFDTPDSGSDPISIKLREDDLRMAAKVTVALNQFVKEKNIDGLAYYYDGEEGSTERDVMTNLIVGNSLLTSNHFPMCGESDLKTLVALLIMDRLGIGGSFAEFHPIDFNEGFVLVGHDGPHNISIAEGKPVLRSLKKFHGKPGNGASVEFKIKEGPITMLSINSTFNGQFKFIIAEGQSVKGSIPPTGNTNTRGFFKPDIKTFLHRWIKEGPTHHFALGIGHHAKTIQKIAEYLDIESVIIKSQEN